MSKNRPLTAEQLRDLRESVRGDVAWLSEVDLTKAPESVLRDASAKLRRLLVDRGGTLMRLRKAQGLRGEPKVTAPSVGTGLHAQFAQAAGGSRLGVAVSNVAVSDRALSEEEIRRRFEAGPPVRTQTLSNWLSSVCMKVGGVSVTRREVVQFVANKLGGVHFDVAREPKNPGYVALDQARSTYGLADLDAVYAELVAIAQQLVSADGVRFVGPGDGPAP